MIASRAGTYLTPERSLDHHGQPPCLRPRLSDSTEEPPPQAGDGRFDGNLERLPEGVIHNQFECAHMSDN
jgi:hypothetical protein